MKELEVARFTSEAGVNPPYIVHHLPHQPQPVTHRTSAFSRIALVRSVRGSIRSALFNANLTLFVLNTISHARSQELLNTVHCRFGNHIYTISREGHSASPSAPRLPPQLLDDALFIRSARCMQCLIRFCLASHS